jgi:hypothetical protein
MLKAMNEFLKRQIDEIKGDRHTAWYGAFLALTHFVSMIAFLNWWQPQIAGSTGNCWPFFETCRSFRINSELAVLALISFYGILASVTTGLFAARVRLGLAYGLFAALLLLKYFLIVQDYRNMGNYHVMPAIICLIYLFVPRKLAVSALFIVAFYVTAGTLKLHPQWLSGFVLGRPPFLDTSTFSALNTYVVYLEMVISFALLAKNRWIKWLAFTQFALFHAASYYWVGFFYPSVMACLLMVFPLGWSKDSQPFALIGLRDSWQPAAALLALYAMFQLYPLAYPGDPAVHGKGRILALNMYDATTKCVDFSLARFSDRTVETSGTFQHYAQRIHCDPILYLDEARRQCARFSLEKDFLDLDLELWSRRTTDFDFQKTISVRDFCSKDHRYEVFGRNHWVED